MLDIAIDRDDKWPQPEEFWLELAEKSLAMAVAQTPFAAIAKSAALLEVSISFADDDTVHGLNRQWRDKDKPTNILSFPMWAAEDLQKLADMAAQNPEDDAVIMTQFAGNMLLGDMILAYETSAREAAEKDWALTDYVRHLLVHGMLHLLGYDHQNDTEAEIMEGLEAKTLAKMGVANPYRDDDHNDEVQN